MTEMESISDQIATRIMGWELLEVRQFDTEEETPKQKLLEDWMDQVNIWEEGDYWIKEGTHFWLRKQNWTPAVDIHQAFLAAKKVLASTGYFELVFVEYSDEYRLYGIPGVWHCSLEKYPPDGMVEEVTAELAICVACLQIVGEKEAVSDR